MSRTLSTIPDKIIEKIKHAQRTGKLDLSAASLTDLPEEILALTNLRTLNLYHNPIKILPTRLLMLTTLRELTLYRTRLIKVPTQLSALVHLTKLHMGSNRLTDLPSEIFALTQLQEIDLSNNQLRVLPSALSRCSALRMVVGFRNRLESLPDCLSTLTALRKLDLRSNELRALPPSLGCLTALQTLLLNDNPLQTPPNFVCQRGRRAVLAFLYQQHQQRHLCTCAAECVVTFFDGGVSPKAYSATGPRPVPRLEVGREHFVRIHARSADRKPRTCGGDVFRASLHRVVGPNATATEEVSALLVRDLGTGVYEVRFCVTLAGLYRLHLTLVNTTNWAVDNVNKHLEKTVSSQSQAVAGSPFPLHLIPSTVSVVHCTAAGSGLEGGVVGIPATFTIRAVDKYGNSTSLVAESDEREQFTVVIDAPDKTTLQSEVTVDREDASLYRVRYTATTPGTHLVSVTLAGLHIRGSPFTVPVIGAITSTAPNETLSTLQSQLHEELIRQAELQRLCSKAERHIGGLKARVAQERQSVRDLLEQRTKLQCELDHLRLTFGELKTAHVRLEEDALLCIHNITIAEWKCSLENKLHDTLRKLEREIRDRSLLEEVSLFSLYSAKTVSRRVLSLALCSNSYDCGF
jgi:regulator of replication initiation timing